MDIGRKIKSYTLGSRLTLMHMGRFPSAPLGDDVANRPYSF